MHTVDRQAEQLHMAGIETVPAPSMDWVDADVSRFGLAAPYVLLVPGGSAHRPEKRWSVGSYTELARRLVARGVTPVLIGAGADAHATGIVDSFCDGARDLTAETSFAEIVALARGAVGAVGNDTGPMHIIATAGCPTVTLYSFASNPALCARYGLFLPTPFLLLNKPTKKPLREVFFWERVQKGIASRSHRSHSLRR